MPLAKIHVLHGVVAAADISPDDLVITLARVAS
jgi:hypothetical protein